MIQMKVDFNTDAMYLIFTYLYWALLVNKRTSCLLLGGSRINPRWRTNHVFTNNNLALRLVPRVWVHTSPHLTTTLKTEKQQMVVGLLKHNELLNGLINQVIEYKAPRSLSLAVHQAQTAYLGYIEGKKTIFRHLLTQLCEAAGYTSGSCFTANFTTKRLNKNKTSR